ncbi:hypothetical protein HYH03_010269 [Edaphochlamys debaryana]|uniref:Uncharacterized protein n=1 Tax=Edaphochlamys debaryana TaxID=47281 RepID=A0A836BWH1_9CHLO|nr:hypothetical protein HYH03_010269 [Edaphochlamys debaryana]|eukprot:KAG2491485.1 hypothetical protein HYH03_010269 [Edaphochlamys debaryana]
MALLGLLGTPSKRPPSPAALVSAQTSLRGRLLHAASPRLSLQDTRRQAASAPSRAPAGQQPRDTASRPQALSSAGSNSGVPGEPSTSSAEATAPSSPARATKRRAPRKAKPPVDGTASASASPSPAGAGVAGTGASVPPGPQVSAGLARDLKAMHSSLKRLATNAAARATAKGKKRAAILEAAAAAAKQGVSAEEKASMRGVAHPPAPAWRAICEVAKLSAPRKTPDPLDVARSWFRFSNEDQDFLEDLDPAFAASRALVLCELLPTNSSLGAPLVRTQPLLAMTEEPRVLVGRVMHMADRLGVPMTQLVDGRSFLGRGVALVPAADKRVLTWLDELTEILTSHLPAAKRPGKLAAAVVLAHAEVFVAFQGAYTREALQERTRLIQQLVAAGDPELQALAATGFDCERAGRAVGLLLLTSVFNLEYRLCQCREAAEAARAPAAPPPKPFTAQQWAAVQADRFKLEQRLRTAVKPSAAERAAAGAGASMAQ